MELAKKLLGLVLVIVGLALAVVGIWFTGHLGTSGTATFTATPSGPGPALLDPSLLNRVAVPMTVTVVPAKGDTVWLGIGAPSDVAAAVGATPATRYTSVVVRDWALVSHRAGTGTPAAIRGSEIWRSQRSSTTPITVTVDQRTAPETYAVAGGTAPAQRIEVTFQRTTWFVQAVVVAVVGLMITAAGAATALARRRNPEEVQA